MDRHARLLGEYEKKFPEEKEKVALCRSFLENPGSLGQEYARGHLTGSAWIMDKTRRNVVLTHHGKLDLWLQTGGHLEEGETACEGALREAGEETGLTSLRFIDESLFDLDIHCIPARSDQPAHYHFDMRFLLEAVGDEPLVISEESRDLRWVALEDIPGYSRYDSVWRMALKSAPYSASPSAMPPYTVSLPGRGDI